MKKDRIYLIAVILLFGCSKPDIQPGNNRTLSIYPNPCIDRGFITVDNRQTSSLKVFDPDGKTILSENVPSGRNEYTAELSGKPEGVYIVVLETGSSVITKKMIKL
jgi:hypothetical protein